MTKLTKQLSRLISSKAAVISKQSSTPPRLLLSFCPAVVEVKVLLEVIGARWLLVSVTVSQPVRPNIPLTVSDNLFL